jgi:hypothetical protein
LIFFKRAVSPSFSVALEVTALPSLGISETSLFLDKQSGKDFNRPAYRKLIKK